MDLNNLFLSHIRYNLEIPDLTFDPKVMTGHETLLFEKAKHLRQLQRWRVPKTELVSVVVMDYCTIVVTPW